MAVLVSWIEVENFRSYERFRLQIDPGLTLLVGPNAVGKTNLVEAVQLLTAAESFRRPQWADVVRWGQSACRAQLVAEGAGRHLSIELVVTREGRREYRLNGKLKRRLTDIAGVVPSVVFTPDDLRLIKDSADKRRSALDVLGSQLSPSYAGLRADYERVVRQRSSLLKDPGSTTAELDAWSERLVEVGSRFADARERLFVRIAQAMSTSYSEVATEDLQAHYLPSWNKDGVETQGSKEESLRAHLRIKHDEEKARGTTLVGPHRDDVIFDLDGRNARTFASQGQQRTLALAWKLAEVMVISDVSGSPPILLLDDVMSELDEGRRHALTSFVGDRVQTVVTTTNLGYFEQTLIDRATVVELS